MRREREQEEGGRRREEERARAYTKLLTRAVLRADLKASSPSMFLMELKLQCRKFERGHGDILPVCCILGS